MAVEEALLSFLAHEEKVWRTRSVYVCVYACVTERERESESVYSWGKVDSSFTKS